MRQILLPISFATAVLLALLGLASVSPASAEEPIVITNDDLPERLSVSVIGPESSEKSSNWPSMEEIAAIAKLNEEARQSYADSRRRAEEGRPTEPEVRDDGFRGFLALGYPWWDSDRYDGRPGKHPRHHRGIAPHGGDALPPPSQGWVARPSKHLKGPAPVRGNHGKGSPARGRALGFVRTR